MDKKKLKRLLKLCEQDNNSLADESIAYKERALKAEAFIERLVKAVRTPERYRVGYSEDVTKIMCWYEKLTDIADEWKNREVSNVR